MSALNVEQIPCCICFTWAFFRALQTLSSPNVKLFLRIKPVKFGFSFVLSVAKTRASYIFSWNNCIFSIQSLQQTIVRLHDFFFFNGCAVKNPFLGQNCIFKDIFFLEMAMYE